MCLTHKMEDDLFSYGGNKPLQFGSTLDETVDNTELLLELEDSDNEQDSRKRKLTEFSGSVMLDLRAKKQRVAADHGSSASGSEDDSKSSKDSLLQDELYLSPDASPLYYNHHNVDWQTNNLIAAADHAVNQLSRTTPAEADVVLNDTTDSQHADSDITIRVRCKGKLYKVSLGQHESIACIAIQLSQLLNVGRDQLILQFKGKDISLSSSPDQLGLSSTDIIDGFLLNVANSGQVTREKNDIEIKIQSLRTSCVYSVGKLEPLRRILKEFAAEIQEDFDKIAFSFDGERIAAHQSASELEIEDKDIIDARIT